MDGLEVEVNGKNLSFLQIVKFYYFFFSYYADLNSLAIFFIVKEREMEHLCILSYFIGLVVGMFAAFYSFQLNKTCRNPFLSYFVKYIVVFNLVIFLYLVTKYAAVNFPGTISSDQDSPFYIIVFVTAMIGEMGLIYTFSQVCRRLLKKAVPNKAHSMFSTLIILVCISCVIGITTRMNTGSSRWLKTTYIGVTLLTFLFLLGMSVWISFQKSEKLENNRKEAIRNFGFLYFAGFLGLFGGASLPEPLKLIISTAALLYLNIIPFIWLKKFFLRFYLQVSSENSVKLLEIIAQDKQISKREREIMELILQGKSNKEIENLLFISYNTVKNHIYKIYQKLGVNSRGQMIHIVLQAQRDWENSIHKKIS